MKIHAHQRLIHASSQSELLKFLSSKSEEEVEWFYNVLPSLFDKWFNASIKKTTKHLPIHFASHVSAAEYTAVDAMAVALGHLKKIYDPKIKRPLYRSILMDKGKERTPSNEVVNFLSKPKWGAMQSWTYLQVPVIGDRTVRKKHFELVLEIPAAEAERHVVTDYMQLGRMAQDAIGLESALEKLFPDAAFNPTRWKVLLRELNAFRNEQEVFLYVPTGTGLKCRWKAREYDDLGWPRPWGYKSSGPDDSTPAKAPVPSVKTTPKTTTEYFKTAGKPFKVGPSIYATVGKVVGGKVMGLPLVEVRKAAEQNKLKGLQPKSLAASQCTPLPGKKFKPEMVGYINKWLKLHP